MKLSMPVLALMVAIASPPAWGQIVTENAGTYSPETPFLQTRFEYARSEFVTEVRAAEVFLWAPANDMDLALNLPVLHRKVEFGNGNEGTLDGLGDATLRWKYWLFKEEGVMASTRFSGLLGVKLPTGRFDQKVDGVEVPRGLQLGTGSFDLYGGPLFTYIDNRHRVAAELIGRYNLERDGFQLQPSIRVGLAYWYRITPELIEVAGEKTEVRGVIEATSTFYGESELDGRGLGDRGNLTWLSPGLQVYPSMWALFEASVQIPIVQTMEDGQGDRKFGALFTVKFLF